MWKKSLCAATGAWLLIAPPAQSTLLKGYLANTYDKESFLSEIDRDYPCWYDICWEVMTWKSKAQRKRVWFERTFYSNRDRKQRKEIELLARRYGIELK